ncbi:signal peptidase I [Aeromicrobium sp. A1-2]|uniref:signal peptidase I n=1 Tax=Aeromicrobium sp. A1-2 TaxID=2107713 RepID=UPI000E4BF279|nr:signal peptidase I [Aeromicrobium sp. A1-2]AXT85351.1 signal peptidase I [Aeromicrobium sp. A1-2]
MEQRGRRRAAAPVRTSWFWQSVLLRIGAVLGAVSLVAAVLCASLGIIPISFRSDSMAPAISSGDLAIARGAPVGDVGPGDVVSVTDRAGGRVTHRIVEVEPYGGSVRLTLKADDSSVPDAETYEVTRVDRVLFAVPLLGFLVGPFHGLIAIVAGGALVACLAFVVVTPRRRVRGTRRS